MLTFLYCYLGLALQAQTFTSLSQADSVTYALYLKGQWKELEEAGKSILKEGIDFYYLRIRVGIANFKLENYHQAIRHFEKAAINNPSAPLLMEYLYYARLNAGRRSEALYGASFFSDELKKYTGTEKPKWIREINVVYNQNLVDNATAIDQFKTVVSPANEEGGQFISDGHRYVYAGLQHELSPSFSYYHAYTNLRKNHFAYAQNDGLANENPQTSASLNQYYGIAQLRVSKNIQWLAGLHYVHINASVPVVQTSPGRDILEWQNTSYAERVLFTGLSFQTTYFNVVGMAYSANLTEKKQIQADAQLTVYPRGNLNLYVSGKFSYQQETLGLTKRKASIFEPLAGGKISKKIWLEAYGALGPQQNYIAASGAVLYNTLDKITSRVGARLQIFPSSKFKILFEGVWLKNESTFQSTDYLNPTYNPIIFNSYSITGGLSWYF